MAGLENININLGSENTESVKWHFFYFNEEISDHPVIFDCLAESRAAADLLYEEKMGKKLAESDHIGCTSVKI